MNTKFYIRLFLVFLLSSFFSPNLEAIVITGSSSQIVKLRSSEFPTGGTIANDTLHAFQDFHFAMGAGPYDGSILSNPYGLTETFSSISESQLILDAVLNRWREVFFKANCGDALEEQFFNAYPTSSLPTSAFENNIRFVGQDELLPGLLAITIFKNPTGEHPPTSAEDRVDILINEGNTWQTPFPGMEGNAFGFDLAAVLGHEIGHALGLPHMDQENSIMNHTIVGAPGFFPLAGIPPLPSAFDGHEARMHVIGDLKACPPPI